MIHLSLSSHSHSLVNSIFVDAMVSDNNDELIAKVDQLQKQIETLQQSIDKHNNSIN